MSKVAPLNERIQTGDRVFISHVIPVLRQRFPGKWCSMNGQPSDYLHGVDFIHVNCHQVNTISARIHQTMDYSNFTVRWYRTSEPSRPLEYTTRMEAYKTGGILPDYTVEAFINSQSVTVGIIPTVRLYQYLDRVGDLCPKIIMSNRDDVVYFKCVQFHSVKEHLETFTHYF